MKTLSSLADTALLLGGFVAVIRGIWMIYTPAGYIALGMAMLLTFAVQQSGKRTK